ncbi:Phospholipid-transporting ATPase 1 [Hordeum vulgare]|nr:Phospholipid-transporting ATPase 1 [Hordeum vulgare]
MDLDSFPLDHEFLEDYEQEEEDECDIEGEPLFEEELANQAVWAKLKRKSKRTKAYTTAEDLLRAFQASEAFKVQNSGKGFNLSHCFKKRSWFEKMQTDMLKFDDE